MKISVKCNQELAGFGTITLYKNYLKYFEEYDINQTYDIVFSIYDSCKNVKSKYKVLLCADQNLKTYLNYTRKLKDEANLFTHVILVRYIKEVYEQIKIDFPNCKIFSGNFILFDFDNNYNNVDRNDDIIHIGRLCEFKNSIDLILNPEKYLTKRHIDCYGCNLLNETGLNEKGLKYNKYISNNLINYDKSRKSMINLYDNYQNENLYKITTNYKYCISFYDEKFLDNVEYAMLEMINSGCFIILNESYVKSFNEKSILNNIEEDMFICLHENETIDDAIKKSKIKDIKSYKEKWKNLYDNKRIIDYLIKNIVE